jgi:hypothetical protein
MAGKATFAPAPAQLLGGGPERAPQGRVGAQVCLRPAAPDGPPRARQPPVRRRSRADQLSPPCRAMRSASSDVRCASGQAAGASRNRASPARLACPRGGLHPPADHRGRARERSRSLNRSSTACSPSRSCWAPPSLSPPTAAGQASSRSRRPTPRPPPRPEAHASRRRCVPRSRACWFGLARLMTSRTIRLAGHAAPRPWQQMHFPRPSRARARPPPPTEPPRRGPATAPPAPGRHALDRLPAGECPDISPAP